jgi:putative PIN family toxin of toxin-antitoxin system
VVLDTNVLVSGLLSLHGPPARIVDLAVAGELCLLFDDRVLDEYDDVLRRPRFGFDAVDVDAVLNFIVCDGEAVIAPPLALQLPDAGDQPFAEVAVAARAEALITGNVRHFGAVARHHALRIRSPAAFLAEWRSGRWTS